MNKAFSNNLYEENDRKAKEAVEQLLIGTEYIAKTPDNKYTVDFELYHGDKLVGYVECERKLSFEGKDFPFDTLQLPARKEKFARLDKPTVFIVFDCNFNNYFSFNNYDLLKSELVEVNNKYVPQGEYFFQVPVKTIPMNNLMGSIRNTFESWDIEF